MRTLFPRKLVGPLALLLTAGGLFAVPAPDARADGLPKFTGYTLPGSSGEPMTKVEGKPIAVREEKDGLGATVLYAVYDRAEGRPGDLWNTGIPGLEDSFVAGKDNGGQVTARKLDTQARYLYVYQVINDSGRDSVVKSATVRLLVDPQLITSWGYFFKANAGPNPNPNGPAIGVGVGFAELTTDPKVNMGKPVMLPISTEHPAATDRKYIDRSPYYLASEPYHTSRIDVGNAIKPIGNDPSGASENIGRTPEEVFLLNAAIFDGPPRIFHDRRLQEVSFRANEADLGVTGYTGTYGMGHSGTFGQVYAPSYVSTPCGCGGSSGYFYPVNYSLGCHQAMLGYPANYALGYGQGFSGPGMTSASLYGPQYAPYAPMMASMAMPYGPVMNPYIGMPLSSYGSSLSYQAPTRGVMPNLGFYNPSMTMVGPITTRTTGSMAAMNPAYVRRGVDANAVGPLTRPVSAVGADSAIQGVSADDNRHRSPAIRAFFLDYPLKPKERSTLFGFTSDFPPTYEDVRLRGDSRAALGGVGGAAFGDQNLKTAALTADGEVPTPIAFEAPAAEASVASGFGGVGGFSGGSLGGGGSSGGGPIGGVGGLPGFGGGLGGGGTPSGGGGTTPSSGTGSNGTTPTTPTTPTGNTVVNANNQQQQAQGQFQLGGFPESAAFLAALLGLPAAESALFAEEQALLREERRFLREERKFLRTSQHHIPTPPHAVVPEPAAVIAALLGLPAFLLFAKRKKTARPEVVNEETPKV